MGDTVKPRLMEADADLERVLVIDDRDTDVYKRQIQGNLLTNTTLLENHYNDYYFGVMQIEPPFEENEEESKESEFWNDLYESSF